MLPLSGISLGLAFFVFAIEPCSSALAGLGAVARQLDDARFGHGGFEGLAHCTAVSSLVNWPTRILNMLPCFSGSCLGDDHGTHAILLSQHTTSLS